MDLVSDSSSDGSLGGVTDNVDGTYSATLTAASSAGSDVVRALVDGTPISTVTVNYRGPVDGDASDFTAAPRRLRFDGESESTITLVPRDQNGVPFGAGHAVDITLLGSPGASVGATSDGGDGSYTATVTAGFEEETAMAAAEVDSVLMAGFLPVGIGFPLSTVVQESVAALDDALAADPPPSAKAAPKISKARSILAAVQGLSDVDDADPILAAVAKALKQLEAARKKGADAGEVLTDLAEAARESASAAMDAAEPNVSTGPEEAALAKAETLFAAGEGLLDAGTLSKAAAKYRAALKQTLKIHP
jgi:adhesin/invasin